MVQDSTAVSVVTDTVSPLVVLGVGVLSSLATGVIRSGTQAVDRALGKVDTTITHAIGPVWPLVTTGIAAVLPMLGNVIGVTDLPAAAVIASAPASAIVGVALRELFRRIVPEAKPTP